MIGAAAVFTLLGFAQAGPVATGDAELRRGIHLVQEGDFEGGLLALDEVARTLAADPARQAEAAQAYLHIGVAYLGLAQEGLARTRFQQSLAADPMIRPGANAFSPRVLRTFEAALKQYTEALALEKKAARRRRTAFIALASGGAAAATVVAVGGRNNTAPTASFTVTPPGAALLGATRMTFTARATDADGDALRYQWLFGDSSQAEGETVTHVYTREGSFEVELQVSDGVTTTRASQTLVVRAINGRWGFTSPFGGRVALELLHMGGEQLQVRHTYYAIGTAMEPLAGIDGRLTDIQNGRVRDPRVVELPYETWPEGNRPCWMSFEGQADADVQTITGRLSCGNCSCRGRSETVSLRRE